MGCKTAWVYANRSFAIPVHHSIPVMIIEGPDHDHDHGHGGVVVVLRGHSSGRCEAMRGVVGRRRGCLRVLVSRVPGPLPPPQNSRQLS